MSGQGSLREPSKKDRIFWEADESKEHVGLWATKLKRINFVRFSPKALANTEGCGTGTKCVEPVLRWALIELII